MNYPQMAQAQSAIIGGYANAPVNPSLCTNEIGEGMVRLQSLASDIHEFITSLEDRLHSVLIHPEQPKATGAVPHPVRNSPLGEGLHLHAEQLQYALERLNLLRDRVQL